MARKVETETSPVSSMLCKAWMMTNMSSTPMPIMRKGIMAWRGENNKPAPFMMIIIRTSSPIGA